MTMFERFTQDARQVVMAAQLQARGLQHDRIGTEHLLLAMLTQPRSVAARSLHGHGLTLGRATQAVIAFRCDPAGVDLDAEALRAIGIDLDAVRARVEASFGEGALGIAGTTGRGTGRRRSGAGHLAFSPRAKKTLELALREAIRLKQNAIADGHLLLGILREGQGMAALVLTSTGIDHQVLRSELEQQLRQAG